ncbi:MAG: hypothetical protein A2054_05525 [Deltaproteobacteria bacterium GWA2_55_10]|nr:MAG: hypothetical protein A2054_05525 [Deltaproteobacteria bacterium GWA2_55_10]
MSMRKLTIPLAVALAFAVLAPVLYCLYVSATAWSVLASAVSISASFILWRVAMMLARRFEASVPVPAPPRESNGADAGESKRLVVELACARAQAQETEKKLKKTISDLEEFALLAIRRELKMQELRERFVQLKRDHEINRDFPD